MALASDAYLAVLDSYALLDVSLEALESLEILEMVMKKNWILLVRRW